MNTGLKWKLAVGFLLVFLAGLTTGSFAWKWHGHPWGPPPGELGQRLNERLRHELRLTPAQAAKIAPIIEQSAKKLEAIRVESAQRVRQTFVETHRQIAPQLTPEQRTKLAAMEERHRHWRDRHRNFREPPPSPPEESPVP
jgi:Spy/CpxP family protein refolding chaperone